MECIGNDILDELQVPPPRRKWVLLFSSHLTSYSPRCSFPEWGSTYPRSTACNICIYTCRPCPTSHAYDDSSSQLPEALDRLKRDLAGSSRSAKLFESWKRARPLESSPADDLLCLGPYNVLTFLLLSDRRVLLTSFPLAVTVSNEKVPSSVNGHKLLSTAPPRPALPCLFPYLVPERSSHCWSSQMASFCQERGSECHFVRH